MKFSIATALSITAMAASASANPIFADAETAASFDKRDLPLIFKFMIDGDTQGYLSELPNGMVLATDADYNAIDLTQLPPDDELLLETIVEFENAGHAKRSEDVEERHHKHGDDGKKHHHHHHGFLHRIGRVIHKFEHEAWHTLKCVGEHVVTHCGLDFGECAESGQSPTQCTKGIVCSGQELVHCF